MPIALHLDPAHVKRLIEVELLTQHKAAELLGCSRAHIGRMCKRLGLRTQRTGPQAGAKHTGWKGGRRLIGNYWYVYAPLHPNRTKRKLVAEHRLLCEARLGRYLTRLEAVHHMNGNPQDNRIENLVVFPSNADHLRHELTGKCPNWTPEGWASILRTNRQNGIHHSQRASGAPKPPPAIAHPQTTAEHTALPVSLSAVPPMS